MMVHLPLSKNIDKLYLYYYILISRVDKNNNISLIRKQAGKRSFAMDIASRRRLCAVKVQSYSVGVDEITNMEQ